MERDKSYIIYIFLHEKRYIMYIVKYFSKLYIVMTVLYIL